MKQVTIFCTSELQLYICSSARNVCIPKELNLCYRFNKCLLWLCWEAHWQKHSSLWQELAPDRSHTEGRLGRKWRTPDRSPETQVPRAPRRCRPALGLFDCSWILFLSLTCENWLRQFLKSLHGLVITIMPVNGGIYWALTNCRLLVLFA